MLTSVVIAYLVGSINSISIYNAIIGIRGLPYLPGYKIKPNSLICAKDMVEASINYLPEYANLRNLVSSFKNASIFSIIPIIDIQGYIIGELNAGNTKNYLSERYEKDACILSRESRMRIFQQLTQDDELQFAELSMTTDQEINGF